VATAAAQVADDDLAERLAEILREEARRHGVPLA
jgi:beta-glucosidase-like glycosyl hydrolase